MSSLWQKYKSVLVLVLSAIVCISFFVYILALFEDYTTEVNEQAASRAELYMEEQLRLMQSQCDELKREVSYFAARLEECETQEQMLAVLRGVRSSVGGEGLLLDVLYELDDGLFAINGTRADYPELTALRAVTGVSLSRVFQYENRDMAIAASASIESALVGRLVLVYDRNVLSLPRGGEASACISDAELALLCKHDGRVMERVEHSDLLEVGTEPVQLGTIGTLLADGDRISAMTDTMLRGGVITLPLQKDREELILGVGALGEKYGSLSVLSVYRVSTLYGESYDVIQSISAALLGLVLLIVVMLASVIVTRVAARRRIYRMEMIDPYLNCATLKKFEKTASEILKRHPSTSFVLVSLQISNYGYVTENHGEERARELAKHSAEVIRHAIYLEECFAYAGEGELVLLLHYRDRQSLVERLNGMYLRLSLFHGEEGETEEEGYKINASFAAYEIEREEEQTVRTMLDKLKLAREFPPAPTASISVCFYEGEMRKSYLKKAEIEGKMEQALKNSEFHLFYQPKYSLSKKTLDGSEILVRWYDPKLEQYRSPGEFLPVFEENGFIVKLDHFVFFKACENIASRVDRRQISYPISVNVSRITAIQPDFVDYYVRIKKKFNIKDRFITLEFTESFAYENYDFLGSIVDRLHQNGLLCSIDDFGTGYSSYHILKSIPMDEIKLDKFFLCKGRSPERDQTLLKSVIEMVKKLDMKVTQEGVETQEDLYRLDELGCEVIQGYYFARPMKFTDYCEFIDKNFG